MRVLSSSWALLATLASATGTGGGNGILRASRCLAGTHNCHDNAVCTYARGSITPQCTCRRGYVGDGFTCQDLDECITYRHDCSYDETCVNTEGGFYCKKRENADGSRLTIPGQACFDGSNTCHNLATCVPDNNLLGYDCICHEGFYGNGGGLGPGAPGCNDIDECATANECNSLGSNCVNTFGAYICKSNPDPHLVCDKAECDPLAMCVANPLTKRGYDCVCKDGFFGNGNARMAVAASSEDDSRTLAILGGGSSRGCRDIDECATGQHFCFGQTCVNSPGSFFCTQTQDPWGVCAEGAHKCHEHAMCIPSAANRGYDCLCKAGYTGNGNSEADFWSDQRSIRGCVDVDECRTKQHNCIPNAQQCVNVNPDEGGFICVDILDFETCASAGINAEETCGHEGYDCYTYEMFDKKLNKTLTYKACTDFDECKKGTDTCSAEQSCKNMAGSFVCLGLADVSNVCTQNPCPEGQACTPMGDGTYECSGGAAPSPCDTKTCDEVDHICMEVGTEDPVAVCVDVNDSNGDPHGLCDTYYCGENMECAVTGAKYDTRECKCVDGYQPDGNGGCSDEDECDLDTHTCDNDTPFCKNTVGSYMCLSDSGLSDWWCALKPGICGTFDAGANCTATEPTKGNPEFRCVCSDGYTQTQADADPAVNPHLAQCRDRVDCYPGSTFCGDDFCIEKIGEDAVCTNATDPLNLCTGTAPCGVHGDCSLSDDKRERVCSCHEGYRLEAVVAGSDAKICKDVDECLLDKNLGDNVCAVWETCVNTPGSFKCEARPDPLGVCAGASSPCFGVVGALCVVSDDKVSASCKCKDGYSFDNNECTDIDECAENDEKHNCKASQACANVPGGFFCVDLDGPCAEGAHTCHADARCIPSYAKRGYDCMCLSGYHGRGEAPKNRTAEAQDIIAMGPNGPSGCVDNDECEGGNHDCHPDETCQNTKGSYTCSLEYDPYNVCAKHAHNCHPLASCTPIFPNGKAGHQCTCRAGYQGNGEVCVNQNECALDLDDCSSHQFCVDLDGSYECIGTFDPLSVCASNDCNPLLEKCIPNINRESGYECKDINECAANPGPCSLTQSCINTNYGAGYICIGQPDKNKVCAAGGPADRHCSAQTAKCVVANTIQGYRCQDIDECKDSNPCTDPVRSKCVNKNPGYACVDPAGDALLKCKKVDCGDNATCDVDDITGNPECTCNSGFAPGLDMNVCVDIDECTAGLDNCIGTTCVNIVGSYHCDDGSDPHGVCAVKPCDTLISTCMPSGANLDKAECMCVAGYDHPNDNGVIDILACVDVDECEAGTHLCGNTAACVNNQGSYTCDSNNPDPYDLCTSADSVGAVSCAAMGDTSAACNIVGASKSSFTCVCSTGFVNKLQEGPGYETCADINECEGTNSCKADETCLNNAGSYTCDSSADPFNVCAEGAHKCGSGAVKCTANNIRGGYDCTCKSGFRQMVNLPHTQCVDVDECAEASHSCDSDKGQLCVNLAGVQTVDVLGATDQDVSVTTAQQGFQCQWKSLVDPFGVCHGPGARICFGAESSCVVNPHDKSESYCECSDGFFYQEGIGCSDIDECKYAGLNECTFMEQCVNTVGSFVCVPNPDPFGHCSKDKCHPKAVCQPGSLGGNDFRCFCADGYEGDGLMKASRVELESDEKGKKKKNRGCNDINECDLGMDHCQSVGKFCKNTEGSYDCVDEASVKHPCGSGAHDCHHLAQCEVSPSSKSGYICKCKHGYQGAGRESKRALTGEIVANGTPRGCADVDECKFGHHNCAFGQFCHNTIGGFKCMGPAQSPTPCESLKNTKNACGSGLKCVHTDNGAPKCVDIDECIEKADACPYGKTCVNKAGGFDCLANVAPADPCNSDPCDPTMDCVSLGTTFACLDKNECRSGNDCNHGEICYNIDGGYVCVPDPGSICAVGAHNCHADAQCIPNDNQKKGYDCVCDLGYYGNGNKGSARATFLDIAQSASGPRGCTDIDECNNAAANNCGNKVCINTPGSYYCASQSIGPDLGEELCAAGAHNCDLTEDCIVDSNAKHGRRCECKTGFNLKHGKCKDIDECELQTHNCKPLQVCWNTLGHFECLGKEDPLDSCKDVDCGSGFNCVAYANRQGFKCVDNNECTDGTNICKDSETCINFAGSYACKSSDGPDAGPDPCDTHKCADTSKCVTVGKVATCVDINECVELVHPCPWGEVCINEKNGYNCVPDVHHVCGHKGKHNCDDSKSTCVPLGGGKKNYECICDAGYEGNREKGCKDVNECLADDVCAEGEYCINTAGSFVCYPDEVTQTDVETPCDKNDCDINAYCVVNYHSKNDYDCICNSGFEGDGIAKFSKRTLMASGQDKGCANIDECKLGTHTCGANQGCVDTNGGFNCVDDPFGVCEETKHTCNAGSVCQPKPGQLWDYECICRAGFEDTCMAECGTTWSFCYRSCINRVGKGNYCVDVDECGLGLDDCHSIVVDKNSINANEDHIVSEEGTHETTCVNTPGNFYCTTLKDPLSLCSNWENNDCNNSTTDCTIDEDNRLQYTCEPKPGYKVNVEGEVVDIDECNETDDAGTCEHYADRNYDCPVVNQAQADQQRCFNNGIATGLYCVNKEGNDGFFECVAAADDPFGVCADNPCGVNPRTGEDFACSVDAADARQWTCDCFPEENDAIVPPQLAEWDAAEGKCVDYKNCDNSGGFLKTGLAGEGAECAQGEFCLEGDFTEHTCTTEDDPYNVCEGVDCGLGTCMPVQTSRKDYKCHCPDQTKYFQIPADNNHGNPMDPGSKGKCEDLDECAVYEGTAQQVCPPVNDPDATFCMNEEHGYSCTNLDDPYGVCTDINTCGPNGECTLSDDRKEAICGCRSGFTDICEDACEFSIVPSCYEQCIASLVTQQRCKNINECDKKNPTHACLTTEECFDIEGSYLCRNQCQLSDPCDENASCQADYSKDGFTCTCNAGYHGDGINQSPTKAPLLPEDIDMSLLVGMGQKKNKEFAGCQDIDECALKLHSCDTENGELCINTVYNETTKMGYECNAEVDPFGACAFNAHDCHPLASCVVDHMAEEGYTCECDAGFYGNGKFHFIDVDGRKRRSDEPPYGADEWWKPEPYNPTQRGSNADVKGCLDIDECFFELDNCDVGEQCYNSVGSFYCIADMTTPAPIQIVDNVECFINGIECDKAGLCYLDPLATKTNGYNCKCPDGFRGKGTVFQDERGGKNRGCEDINECEEKTHNCIDWSGEFCKNTEGGFDCLVNEMCMPGNNTCHPTATCSEVGLDKFNCECPLGYKGNGRGHDGCVDIDECGGNHQCHSTAVCINMDGTYECRCPHDASLVSPLVGCTGKCFKIDKSCM